MSQKVITTFTLFLFIILMILGLMALANYYNDLANQASQIYRFPALL
jgi:hypothetical protein